MAFWSLAIMASTLPAGSCDCHAHVFGPQHRYPYLPNAAYIPPDALQAPAFQALLKLARSKHCWWWTIPRGSTAFVEFCAK